MSETETKSSGKRSSKTATDGDHNAEPGTPEHLGSDRPYEGQSPDEAAPKVIPLGGRRA